MGTEIVTYNTPVKMGAQHPSFDLSELPSVYLKAIPIEQAMEFRLLEPIVRAAPIIGEHKFINVDVKVQDLQVGDVTCIPGWHCDTAIDPMHPGKPENHHLFVTDLAPTEFITTPFSMPRMHSLQLQREYIDRLGLASAPIPARRWVSYGRFHFHRGPVIATAGRRLLIRVSETDLIVPRRK